MTDEPLGDDLFKRLAKDEPERLVALLSSAELPPHLLTFAAEFASDARSEHVHEALIKLLDHARPVVREGAVYGLNGHRSAEITQALRAAMGRDQSRGVREALAEALAMLEQEERETPESRASCSCAGERQPEG